MPHADPDFLAVLLELAGKDVDFIIVGGVGAVLQGAPVATFDLDVVHSRDPENLRRLLSALEALDARYRDPAGRLIKPTAGGLAGPGHHLLMTRSGPLDLLGAVSGERGYGELLADSVEMEIAPNAVVRVLDLAVLITLKEELGRDKDRAVLAVLRRTLEERDHPGNAS